VAEFEETIADLDLEEDLNPEDKNFLLLPPRLLGYATREKVWAQFSIRSIKPTQGKQPKKFQDILQLVPKYKKLIEALVASYDLKRANQVPDVIQDKGTGLALLFHGMSHI